MALFGELFLSELLKQPVLDPTGEILGQVKDIIVVKGDPLPRMSALIVERKGQAYQIPWPQLNLFNKRIISSYLSLGQTPAYSMNDDDLLAVRDLLDKQIVDANGAKVVRVNDIKLEGYGKDVVLIAVDVGMRGILRRLGVERSSEQFLQFFNTNLPSNLISWNYIQHLQPKQQAVTLTVPRQIISDLHPADLAEIISQVSRQDGAHLFKDLDIETAAEALSELEPEMQAEILSAIDTAHAADIIEEMPPDDAADILSDLPTEQAKAILEHIEQEEAEDIQELLGHEDDTAGGLMTTEFLAYRPTMTVAEAIDSFRHDALEVEYVYYIFVIDEDDHLQGVTSLREMLLAAPDTILAEIMESKVKSVSADCDEMVVAETVAKYNLVALPVVDSEGVMLGMITVDDVIDRILPPSPKRTRRKV